MKLFVRQVNFVVTEFYWNRTQSASHAEASAEKWCHEFARNWDEVDWEKIYWMCGKLLMKFKLILFDFVSMHKAFEYKQLI